MPTLTSPIALIRPQTIDFGPGRASHVGPWASAKNVKRIFVVTDAYNANRLDRLALAGDPMVFDAVKPEPDLPNLDTLIAAVEQARPEVIIGFGGGSAMDMAKLASVLPGSGQTFRDVVGADKVNGRQVFLVQVPTTAGTGSEAGMRALISDPEARSKLAVESRHMLADLAVVDPALTLTVPPALTAATGVDALAHCVESYTSKRAHPTIDIYALDGIRLAGRYLKRAVEDGEDLEARSAMALASLYGGFCLGPVNTTAGHAISYPLGTRHQLPHGLANALIFPRTLGFNAKAAPDKTADVLEALGNAGAPEEAGIVAAATAFTQALGIAPRLSDHGVPEADLPVMAEDAAQIRRLLDHNPRDIGRDDILAIYRAVY